MNKKTITITINEECLNDIKYLLKDYISYEDICDILKPEEYPDDEEYYIAVEKYMNNIDEFVSQL